ncbi:MAG: polysaccharide biosynthesis C-terminal domain-containing protein [Saprospiraceae bacterium]|nr:polysaccharide biosynthesis C-terminal domain-containing protein [Saprospiraceae bacterium]
MLDRQLLRFLLPGSEDEVRAQIGIYSANYRLAMVISLFTQAFRYAAEPFFFRESGSATAQQTYARVSRLFTLAASVGLLIILLFQDWLKFFIGREGSTFHDGLKVLPVLLTANILLGLYYNFSVWYKLTDKTRSGAWISIGGAFITILGNVLFIPQYGYVASAWTTLVCYAIMVIVSYAWGQKHYPVPYQMGRMGMYIGSALLVVGLARTLLDGLPDQYRLMTYVGITLFFIAGWGIPERRMLTRSE